MRPPAEAEIYAPEFPRGLDWLNVAFLRMNTLMGRGAVLVEFWDFARDQLAADAALPEGVARALLATRGCA